MKGHERIQLQETVMNVDITPDIWFQQDSATAHTSVIARDWLKSRFGNKVISHRTDFLNKVTYRSVRSGAVLRTRSGAVFKT